MKQDMKHAYESIQMSEDARTRIKQEILAGQPARRQRPLNALLNSPWKAAVAASICLALVVPTGAVAAHKIYQHFKTTVSEHGYRVDMQMKQDTQANTGQTTQTSTPKQFLHLSADFGENYTPEKDFGPMQCYTHKDGFDAGKDFWYELEYMDTSDEDLLSVFDVESKQEVDINGNRAIYCRYNNVVGSRYDKDHDTDYGQTLYIFLEDTGYMISMGAQNGLSQKTFLDLARSIQIQTVDSRSEASKFVFFSKRQGGAWNYAASEETPTALTDSQYHKGDTAYLGLKEAKYTIKDVKLLDSISSLDKNAFLSGQKRFLSHISTDGTLKRYIREDVTYGDGIQRPAMKVTGSQKIQPKLLYVTMEIQNSFAALDEDYIQVPSLRFLTYKDGQYYLKSRTGFNRPSYIDDAFIDNMPCYLEESLGGKSGWFAKSSGGTITLHFAYLVDEDQLEHAALCLNDWVSSSTRSTYLDISQPKSEN